ncbi:MAG: NAD(P)-dependent oxidoreductase [Alphaproteobacteria bacterium]|nr:NAD(P)-dependent oxidoreductase [Alphaproteobacteria bacterium]
MRCFLTGANGFIGSYILRALLDGGHSVAVLVRRGADRKRIANQIDRITVLEGTLEVISDWQAGLASFAPDIVIHAAWHGVSGTDRNQAIQARNTVAAAELAAMAAALGASTFVGLGSQAEYGPFSQRADEQLPTRPTTLYGIAKLAAAQMTERLCELNGLRWAWLRVFSIYGPEDRGNWLIPFLIDKLSHNQSPSLSRCEQLWDFLYAADAAAAVVAVVNTATATGIFNLGSGHAPPLLETVTLLRDMISPQTPLGIGELPYRPDQGMHLEADITRLHKITGWQPIWTLSEGLAETVKWHQEQRS